jgi:hypothetical protein
MGYLLEDDRGNVYRYGVYPDLHRPDLDERLRS